MIPIRGRVPLATAALLLFAAPVAAQGAGDACGRGPVIPLVGTEPPATIAVEPPLAEPLASRRVVIIPYCTRNLRIVPVFGPGALSVSPRVGHVHVTVDDATYVWADASGTPIVLAGLAPGRHTVRLELMTANHQELDEDAVTFEVPAQDQTGMGGGT